MNEEKIMKELRAIREQIKEVPVIIYEILKNYDLPLTAEAEEAMLEDQMADLEDELQEEEA